MSDTIWFEEDGKLMVWFPGGEPFEVREPAAPAPPEGLRHAAELPQLPEEEPGRSANWDPDGGGVWFYPTANKKPGLPEED